MFLVLARLTKYPGDKRCISVGARKTVKQPPIHTVPSPHEGRTSLGVRKVLIAAVGGLIAVVIGAGLGFGVGSAYGYPWREGSCDGLASLGYYFAGPNWTAERQGWFTDGANDWDSIRKPTSGYLVSSATGGTIEIYVEDYGPGGGGKVNCDDLLGNLHHIKIDPTDLTASQFRAVSLHEVGHAHGLDHTGPYDSFDQFVPTMTAGCALTELGLTYDAMLGPQQDDEGSLTAVFFTDYDANDSFERGSALYWGTGGGGSVTIYNGGVDGGAKYAQLNGYGGYMYQSIRLTDPPNTSRARINYKKTYSISTGTVLLTLYSRQLDYSVDTSTDCAGAGQYHNDWNFIVDPTVTGWTYETGVSVTPTTSWQYVPGTTSAWTGASGWDGVDLRVYVYNYMLLEGGPTSVSLDRMRAYQS